MPGHATVLNLVPPSDTDESELRNRLGVEGITMVSGKEVRERGKRQGLAFLREVHRKAGGNVLAIHSVDWSRQSQRTALYTLACLIPARRRVALDKRGNTVALTWLGLLFNEFPRSISQKIAGGRLVRQTRSMLKKSLEHKPVHRAALPGSIEEIIYMRTDLWFDVKAGGSIGHVAGVVNGFVQNGVKVSVLSWSRPPLLDPEVKSIEVAPDKFFVNEREFILLSYNGRLVSRAVEWKKENMPQAVYARYSLDCWAPVTISEMLQVPLILEYNGSEVWIEKHWGRGLRYPDVAQMVEDWVLKNAEVITVVSKPLKDELVERGYEARRILVNPNAVDPSRFDPARFPQDEIDGLKRKLGIPEGTRVAAFIGTFSPWHGVEVLAKAIPMALSNCPRLHFLLIGAGPLFDEVMDQLRVGNVLDRVTFTGLVPQDDAPKYLMCADFFLSPHVPNPDGTPFFGSPTKVFEYMALGKGIIASDLDQLGDILTNEETALLVPPLDMKALATAIERLYEAAELADRLGRAARELVLRKYTWKAHVDRILDHLYGL